MTTNELGSQADAATSTTLHQRQPFATRTPWQRPRASMPFGSLSGDLFDEELARSFRQNARTLAILAGLSCALAVASWTFACIPPMTELFVSWNEAGDAVTSQVPDAYVFLRYYAPFIYGVLASLTVVLAQIRSIQMNIDLLYGEEPPSATVFSGDTEDGLPIKTLLAGIGLLAMGFCMLAALSWGLPQGAPWAWMVHVASCTGISAGAGLATGAIAFLFITDRARFIDSYDLLIPECGADDAYGRRIYLDHMVGIARLLGAAFVLAAIARMLAVLPDDLGTIRMYGLLMPSAVASEDFAHTLLAVTALKGLAPAVLAALALTLLAKVALRSRRFSIEWSIMRIPEYGNAFDDARTSMLRKAALLAGVCILIHLSGVALAQALEDGHLVGVQVSGFASNMLLLATKVVLELIAGLAATQVAAFALTGEGVYANTHKRPALFNDLEAVFTTLDGLMLVRRFTFIIASTTVVASTLTVMMLLCHQPVASWTDLVTNFVTKVAGLS